MIFNKDPPMRASANGQRLFVDEASKINNITEKSEN